MAQSRPVFLQLASIRFPVMAVVSILHRICGVILFFGSGYLLYFLHLALGSEDGFAAAKAMLQTPVHKVILWFALSVTAYHLVAGIRHLSMDLHIGDSLPFGRACAWMTLISAMLLSVAAAAWIWIR